MNPHSQNTQSVEVEDELMVWHNAEGGVTVMEENYQEFVDHIKMIVTTAIESERERIGRVIELLPTFSPNERAYRAEILQALNPKE